MNAKPTPKITYPFMVHWGLLYIKEDSGPTIDLLCAVNANPAIQAIIPVMTSIFPKFLLSILRSITECYFLPLVPNVLLVANVKIGSRTSIHLKYHFRILTVEGNSIHILDLLSLHQI
jgi:hypothetical protein